MRILIAEDEVQLAEGLKYLLDTMMPGVNVIKVLETIRSERSGIPVMMLTAKAEIEERVAGLGGRSGRVPAEAFFYERIHCKGAGPCPQK